IAGVVRVIVRFTVFVPMLNRLGERATARLGLGIFVVTYMALGFVVNQWQFAAVVCAVSFAASCTRGVLTSFLSSAVPPSQRGQAMGASASLDNLAQIIGPSVGGAVLGAMPVWVYGGLAGVVALVAFILDFRSPQVTVVQAEVKG
ncbi:MAG: solute carrier family 22 member 18, partial [Chloroflexi bacterium]|nr:solute carrier family 22 member 18 [Chloroflexota bacterium]